MESTISVHLEQADDEARTILDSFEEGGGDDGLMTAGVGLFYFETESF